MRLSRVPPRDLTPFSRHRAGVPLIGKENPGMKTVISRKAEKTAVPAKPMSPLVKGIRRDWQLILIALPSVACLAIFAYGSMFGVLYAFQDVGLRRSFWENDWVGLKWFKQFFSSIYAGRVIKNTLILNFWSLAAGTTVEILLALIFNEVKDGKFKRFTQSCSYFPNFISVTVVVGIMVTMLNPNSGVLSLLFQKVFGMEPIDMFTEPSFFRPMYVISGIWQGAGWGSIIYLGAINGIDQSLYEAAAVDGCGRLARIRHITLPGMKQVIVTCLILHIGSMMSLGAGKILLMYSPSIYETADVISTFVYRYGIGNSQLGYGTAVGLFNSVVNLLLLVITNAISKKLADTSLF